MTGSWFTPRALLAGLLGVIALAAAATLVAGGYSILTGGHPAFDASESAVSEARAFLVLMSAMAGVAAGMVLLLWAVLPLVSLAAGTALRDFSAVMAVGGSLFAGPGLASVLGIGAWWGLALPLLCGAVLVWMGWRSRSGTWTFEISLHQIKRMFAVQVEADEPLESVDYGSSWEGVADRVAAYLIPLALGGVGIFGAAALLHHGWPFVKLALSPWPAELDTTAPAQTILEILIAAAIGVLGAAAVLATVRTAQKLLGRTASRLARILSGLTFMLVISAMAVVLATVVIARFQVSGMPALEFALVIFVLLFLTARGTSALLIAGTRVTAVRRRIMEIVWAVRGFRFWQHSQRILNAFPQPSDPKGYVFLSTQADTYTIASMLLILCRLRQLGWALIVLDRWPIAVQKTGDARLDRMFRYKFAAEKSPNFAWTVDWDNKIVSAAGMNFYHPIWEGLSRHFGRYTLVMEKGSEVEAIFNDILDVADSTLLVCFRILNTVAGQGVPVRIAGGSGQFVPNAVYNIFCREIGRQRDMHFVWLQQGYQTYYKDQSDVSTRISIQNMTRKWPYSNPYLPAPDDFERYVERGHDVEEIIEEARAWTRINRATDAEELDQPVRLAVERIERHKQSGGKIVCVLGKMVFDLSTPWEKGPAHDGMFDWLNHTVEAVRGCDDILLLVKPHPYEARPEIAGSVAQYFTDMIEKAVPDNVLILGHDWLNLHALFPHIDLGVLWNGTSGLELGLQGIPVVICSDWGPVDYPVGFCTPTDRDHYAELLRHPERVTVPENYSERCAMLLKYTQDTEVMIPYDYSVRPLTNKPFGPPIWHMDKVDAFIRDGDQWIDLAASRFE